MNDEIKKDIKNLARRTENLLAGSLLRWKYRKEGKELPGDERIQVESERVTDQANRILLERGKRAWYGIKKACIQSDETEDGKG